MNTPKLSQAVPTMIDPDLNPNNLANPYGWNVVDSSRGEAYFNAPASNSTMVSDAVEMTKRLKMFIPTSSVKEGREPINNLGYANSEMNWNEGNYKAKYQ
jgi:hypothetical protein